MFTEHSEESNIWIAASDGDIDYVKNAISSGVSPMEKDENGYTMIHVSLKGEKQCF